MIFEDLTYRYRSKPSDKKAMKKPRLIAISAATAAAVGIIASLVMFKTAAIEPGYVGVYYDRPYFFGNEGVRRKEIISEGRRWIWRSTEVISVVSVPYKQPVRIDDFATIDNYLVDFDSVVSLRITDAPTIVADWRLTFWSQTLLAEYNSIVRREVAKYTLYQLMSSNDSLQALDADITKKMRDYIQSIKIPVAIENVALGRAKPTAEVVAQLNETARRNEESQTNIRKATAELERKNAETNRALADRAYSREIGIDAEQFTRIRIAELQTQACMKASSCVIGIERVVPAGK